MFYKYFLIYKEIFDKKIKNSSFIIFIIAFLIIFTWNIIPNSSYANSKINILETQKQNNKNFNTIIQINWKKYKLYLEEIK